MASEQGFTGSRVGFDVVDRTLVPPEINNPIRLPDFLQQWLPDAFPSPSRAKKACRKGEILVNGKIRRVGDSVQAGDVIERQLRSQPGLFPQGVPPFEMDVAYEDDFMAVVVKPPGISTHGNTDDGVKTRQTVRACLPYVLSPTKASDHNILRRPIHVHRLDRPTGGLLVAAKTREALVKLSEQFRRRGLKKKRYRAIVVGRLEGEGRIEEPLDGKPSVTDYKVVEHTRSLKFDWLTTVDLYPETGRTHQLRRHMSKIGHSILGDERYSPADQILAGHGLFLWALELTFQHPFSEEMVHVTIDEPSKFKTWRHRENHRWKKLSDLDGEDKDSTNTENLEILDAFITTGETPVKNT